MTEKKNPTVPEKEPETENKKSAASVEKPGIKKKNPAAPKQPMPEKKKRALLISLVIVVSVLLIGGIVTASVLFTVGVPASELYFDRESVAIAVGDSVELPIVFSPKIAAVKYFSYNEDFAKVEDGRLVGIGTGGLAYATTVIEATSGDKVARLNVTVFNSTDIGIGADYVITLLEANEQFDGYRKVLRVIGKSHGSRLTESEVAVESDEPGYMFSGEWFLDAACTEQVDFSTLLPISKSFALYTEPRFLRDGTTRQTKGGKWIDVGIDLVVRMTTDDNAMLVVDGLKYPELPYTSIQIPKEYYFNGMTRPVDGIDSNAFDATKNKLNTEGATGDYAKLAETLKTVIMPSTVKVIGSNAFNGLTSLERVEARLPGRALYFSDPNNPRAGEAAPETKDAHFDGIGNDAFAGTKWLESETKKVHHRIEDGKTLEYYSGAVLSNCLIGVDEELLREKYGNKLHFFPLGSSDNGLSVDVIANLLSFENNVIFVVDESEVEDYRILVSRSGLAGKVTVVARE